MNTVVGNSYRAKATYREENTVTTLRRSLMAFTAWGSNSKRLPVRETKRLRNLYNTNIAARITAVAIYRIHPVEMNSMSPVIFSTSLEYIRIQQEFQNQHQKAFGWTRAQIHKRVDYTRSNTYVRA